MKEILSFFSLSLTSFTFIRKYFDVKRFDFYSIMLFQCIIFLPVVMILFYIDYILYSKLSDFNIFTDILMVIVFISLTIFFTTYIATYRLSLNHFIIFVDKFSSIYERKSIVSPFNKEFMKVQNEKTLVKVYKGKNRVYQYIYNYQIEEFEYINKESEYYQEFVCQKIKGNWKRIFQCNIKIKRYFLILFVLFLMTTVTAFIFLYTKILLFIVLMMHALIYILSIGHLLKINMSLYRENDKDKLKVMRYLRSFIHR
ncbi:TPA: hypothetical protein ACU1UG_000970 [Staphylococcus aureus]